MYIKKYSDKVNAAVKEGKKFSVRYISDNTDVVKIEGNVFRGLKAGTANLTLRMSTVYPGTQDQFDEDNIVMEKSFKVTVIDELQVKMPSLDMSWGSPRADAEARQTGEFGATNITDEYLGHTPNVIENNPEYVKQVEVFYNNNFDAPVTILQFTEGDDLLVASTTLFSAWEHVNSTSSYVYKKLQDFGFEKDAPDDFYWNLYLTKNGVSTRASWEMVIIDNVWFAALQLSYNGSEDTAVEEIEKEFPRFEVNTIGNTIRINAAEYAGAKVLLSDVNGKILVDTVVMNSGNEFIVPGHGLYILKIEGYRAVKVLI